MKRTTNRRVAKLAAYALVACTFLWSGGAHAQAVRGSDLSRVLELLQRQEQQLNEQEQLLNEQRRQLLEQQGVIERQQRRIDELTGGHETHLDESRSGTPPTNIGRQHSSADEPIRLNRPAPRTLIQGDFDNAQANAAASPAEGGQASAADALPQDQNALLRRGRLVIEPAIEYSHRSGDHLVFRGAPIGTDSDIGLIEASETDRDTLIATAAVRYAVTDRFEVEARVPFIYRSDRVATTTSAFELDHADLGDAEVSARYQLNSGDNGAPIVIASARVKSDTGLGPFDVDRNEQGVARELSTGSGFWGVRAGLSVLYPTDPAVLFAAAAFQRNIGDDVGRTFGQTTIGHVDPGDAVSVGFGIGSTMNERLSYSISYAHTHVTATEFDVTDANGSLTNQESDDLQIGAMQFGLSFRANERLTIAAGVELGVTEDAPDVTISLRMPFRC